MVTLSRFFGVVFAFLCITTQATHAATVTTSPTGSVEVVGMMNKPFDYTTMSSNITTLTDGKTVRFMGNDLANNGSIDVWDYTWRVDANIDPFIDSTFTITNLTGGTRTFNVSFGLPVSPAFSPAFKSGLLGIDFVDTNGDGSASVTFNSWDGLIDGASAMNLFDASIPCSGVGCTGSIGPVSDGPLFHAAGVNSDIGIDLSFDLSAGDSITVATRFEVTPVPAPAAAWLFGSGLLGLVGIARRKKAT